jgi:hypothetical protein
MSAARAKQVLAFVLAAAAHGCVLDSDLGHWAPADAEAGADEGPLAPDGGSTQELTVSLGFTTSYFDDGRSFPPGEYTLTYADGCWTSGIVAWTVNLDTGEGYWVVGGEPEQRIVMAPGTAGTFAGGLGAFGSYQECVAANVGRSGTTFRFEGGRLGLALADVDPLMSRSILLRGGESEGGRSPTFRLTCAGACR